MEARSNLASECKSLKENSQEKGGMWSESERGSRIYKQKSKLKACGSTVAAFSKTFNWITRFVETRSFFFPGNAYCMVRK